MQGLVLADGYLALLIFWELVGAASARLIAYTRDDPSAAPGAVRAFLTTRAADLGFYLAVLALFTATGTVAFGSVRPDGTLGAVVGLGLVIAAIGKSAQAPLHTWLSAAMAGPTPVSALLHSATMVAAGVYLLVRSQDLLAGWPLQVAGWVGALTAVAGAFIALAQTDLKRVLAGSTTSQLGLMFVGVAAGGPAVALFHLIAHAAGKAGMFLAAGVFQHARGSTDLERLRGAGREDRADVRRLRRLRAEHRGGPAAGCVLEQGAHRRRGRERKRGVVRAGARRCRGQRRVSLAPRVSAVGPGAGGRADAIPADE